MNFVGAICNTDSVPVCCFPSDLFRPVTMLSNFHPGHGGGIAKHGLATSYGIGFAKDFGTGTRTLGLRQ